MAAEMQLHVDLQTELICKAGMNAQEARYAALREFGNVAGVQKQAREQRGFMLPYAEPAQLLQMLEPPVPGG